MSSKYVLAEEAADQSSLTGVGMALFLEGYAAREKELEGLPNENLFLQKKLEQQISHHQHIDNLIQALEKFLNWKENNSFESYDGLKRAYDSYKASKV